MTAKTVVKDGSSFAKRISCLKFEPRSRTFLVKVANWLLLLGKFETVAQILAKRPHRGLLASYITIEKYFSCFDLLK